MPNNKVVTDDKASCKIVMYTIVDGVVETSEDPAGTIIDVPGHSPYLSFYSWFLGPGTVLDSGIMRFLLPSGKCTEALAKAARRLVSPAAAFTALLVAVGLLWQPWRRQPNHSPAAVTPA